MQGTLCTLLHEEAGQDLVEYSLLIAFVAMAGTALAIANGGGIEGILAITKTNLNSAHAAAS